MKIAKGLGVSKGIAKGRVRIVRGIEDHALFNEGDILVTHVTDPTMVPLMNKASGIICAIGGLTSHPSIVSRELGIPCIVSAKCVLTENLVTELLKNNQVISFCGTTGEIYLVDEK